jgi:hypothetical protein
MGAKQDFPRRAGNCQTILPPTVAELATDQDLPVAGGADPAQRFWKGQRRKPPTQKIILCMTLKFHGTSGARQLVLGRNDRGGMALSNIPL